jgi:hypothetical protein
MRNSFAHGNIALLQGPKGKARSLRMDVQHAAHEEAPREVMHTVKPSV